MTMDPGNSHGAGVEATKACIMDRRKELPQDMAKTSDVLDAASLSGRKKQTVEV